MARVQGFALARIVLPHTRRGLIYGKAPGTGKTYMAHRCGVPEGGEVFSHSCQEDGSTADLLGSYVLRDKEMVWQHGVAIMAWLRGATLVVDEIDHASPEVRSLFHRICDDPDFARITLPTGEDVRPAPGFRIIATMNGEPSDLPEALRSRFPVQIHITEANPEALQALPEDVRALAKSTATHEDEMRRISLRAWFEFVHLREACGNEEHAAAATFQHRATEILDALKLSARPVTARK